MGGCTVVYTTLWSNTLLKRKKKWIQCNLVINVYSAVLNQSLSGFTRRQVSTSALQYQSGKNPVRTIKNKGLGSDLHP